jgi:hypothetical protein
LKIFFAVFKVLSKEIDVHQIENNLNEILAPSNAPFTQTSLHTLGKWDFAVRTMPPLVARHPPKVIQ